MEMKTFTKILLILGAAVSPAFAMGDPEIEDHNPTYAPCASAAIRMEGRYLACLVKTAAAYTKNRSRVNARLAYERCDERLERQLSRIESRYEGYNCPEMSAEEIEGNLAEVVIASFQHNSNSLTAQGKLPGVGIAPPGACDGNMNISFVNIESDLRNNYTRLKIALNPGGLSSGFSVCDDLGGCGDAETWSNISQGQTFNGQIQNKCENDGTNPFARCYETFWNIYCESGAAFTANTLGGCDQTVKVSCPGGGGKYGIKFNGPLAGGSWWETCDEDSYDGDTLCAGCATEDSPIRSSHSCLACPSGVWTNENGQLVCD